MTAGLLDTTASVDEDHAALFAARAAGVALCTIVGIEGSFSRRLGAQLAVLPDGSTVGSLSDGCLERQLASDAATLSGPEVRRYGAGSGSIDFRLPCGSGLDILIDPAPDREAIRAAASQLAQRRPVELTLAANPLLARRRYLPALKLRMFGAGPEMDALVSLARSVGVGVETARPDDLTLGRASALPAADRYTAVVLLFHDHEWELALIEEALASPAFYIGAQGGSAAREARMLDLLARGNSEADLARLTSPIGVLPSCKSPATLALSVLTEVMGAYEALRGV